MKITNNINEFITDLNNGKVVCFKTDTIWGLSANPYDNNAIKKLYEIKKRNLNKPFIFLINQNEKLENFVDNITDLENKIVKNFWPNALTVIFNAKQNLKLLQNYTETKTIALRMPKDELCQTILSKINFPLPSTSVNLEGNPSINTFEEIKKFLSNTDVTILNIDNKNTKNVSSTIIKVQDEQIQILRNGDLTKKILDFTI